MYINSPKCGLKCNYKSLMDFCQILEERSGKYKETVYQLCVYFIQIMAKGEAYQVDS